MKKRWFHKDEVRFLGYIVLAQGIKIEDERIEAVKSWLELKLLRDIQVFLNFANFYQQFFQDFSRIASLLFFIFKTSPTPSTKPLLLSADVVSNTEVDGSNGGDEMVKRSPLHTKITIGFTSYLTPDAKISFTQLKKAFTKAPIFCHFDLKCHIQIEIDASGYAIGGVLTQLTLDNLGQWYLIVYFLRKMILVKTRYKTYNGKFLAILKFFKTWRHYLKVCKHKVFLLTNYINLCRFMDIKSLSFSQIYYILELSTYHFWIDYC